MAGRRRKPRNPAPAASRQADNRPLVLDFAEWARGLLNRATNDWSDEEQAVLDGQITSLANVEPSAAILPPDPTAPTIVRDRKALKQVAARLRESPEVVIDIETSALDPFVGEIVGMGLSTAEANYYVPTGHRDRETKLIRPDQLPTDAVARVLRLEELRLVAHNAKFEFRWLRRHAGVTCRFVWDVMLAARLIASHLPAQLKDLAPRELGVPDWSLSKEEIQIIQILPVERVAHYCAKDCRYTMDLFRRQQSCLA
jgi:DNA polymerase I-like protein with 3'-5' exonuclease and polymerase domains